MPAAVAHHRFAPRKTDKPEFIRAVRADLAHGKRCGGV